LIPIIKTHKNLSIFYFLFAIFYFLFLPMREAVACPEIKNKKSKIKNRK